MAPSAVQKYKPGKSAEQTIKFTVTDDDGDEVKELAPAYSSGDSNERVLHVFQRFDNLNKLYSLTGDGKAKKLVQAIGRALAGDADAQETFLDLVSEEITQFNAGNVQAKLRLVQQKFCEDRFGDDALENQCDYFEETQCPKNTPFDEGAQRLFAMNDKLVFYCEGAEKLSPKELNKRVISKAFLPGSARLIYHQKDGPLETTKKGILKKLRLVQQEMELVKSIADEDKAKKRRQPRNDGKSNDDEPSTERKNPCRKHNGEHEWKDCPDNYRNKQRREAERKATDAKSKDGEVNSIDVRAESEGTPHVSFAADFDYDESSAGASQGEVLSLETLHKLTVEDGNPETILALPFAGDASQRIAARALIDPCCAGAEALITPELLQLVAHQPVPLSDVSFDTAAGVLKTSEGAEIFNLSLPLLSGGGSSSFALEMRVMPNGQSSKYDIIVGRDTMRILYLNVDVLTDSFVYNGAKTPLVERGHFTCSRIEQLCDERPDLRMISINQARLLDGIKGMKPREFGSPKLISSGMKPCDASSAEQKLTTDKGMIPSDATATQKLTSDTGTTPCDISSLKFNSGGMIPREAFPSQKLTIDGTTPSDLSLKLNLKSTSASRSGTSKEGEPTKQRKLDTSKLESDGSKSRELKCYDIPKQNGGTRWVKAYQAVGECNASSNELSRPSHFASKSTNQHSTKIDFCSLDG